MPCSGNGSYICGAGNRLSYYTWQGTPFQTWSYPEGNDAGEYVFLIGAPVVALITRCQRQRKSDLHREVRNIVLWQLNWCIRARPLGDQQLYCCLENDDSQD